MAQSTETQVNLKINRIPSKEVLDNMIANNQLLPNQLYMIESEQGDGLVALQTKTLWTNSSPSSDFAAQTISNLGNINNYDNILIEFRNYKLSESALIQIFKSNIDAQGFLTSDFVSSSIEYRRTRRFILAQTSIAFEDNYQMASNSTTPAVNNEGLIPTKIIGIKLVNSQAEVTNVYSTTEQVVGTWIDGKPIYRKVFSGTTPSSSTNTDLHDITSLNLDSCVSLSGYVKSGTYVPMNNSINIQNTYMAGFICSIFLKSSSGIYTHIRGGFGSDVQNSPYTIILEYTKTTD